MPETPRENRGIQNAQARYAEDIESRLTSNVVRRGKEKSTKDSIRQRRPNQQSQAEQFRILASTIRNVFSENGLQYNEGDEKLLLTNPPVKPDFPFLIFLVALCKDFLDIPANFSVVGSFLPLFTTFIVGTVLFFWMFGKMSGGWWKKIMIRGLILWLIGVATIEAMPFGSIIPATTILVLMIYYKEKKIVILFNKILEELHGRKIFK